MRVVRA